MVHVAGINRITIVIPLNGLRPKLEYSLWAYYLDDEEVGDKVAI